MLIWPFERYAAVYQRYINLLDSLKEGIHPAAWVNPSLLNDVLKKENKQPNEKETIACVCNLILMHN